MKKILLAGLCATTLLGGGLTAFHAHAQPAQTDEDGGPPPPPPGGPWHHGPHGGPMGEPGMHGGMMMHHMARTFALIKPADDRKLTAPDVQKIAEAFLLWNGNRDWKVTAVQESGDDIVFAYATKSGDVVAKFKMNKKDGHIERVS